MSNEEIVQEIQQGKNALMADLYMQNKPFIIAVIKRNGIPPELYEDTMQDAYIGLYDAVQGYDEGKGYKFLTYAKLYILRAIQRGQYTPLHLSKHAEEKAQKIKRAQNEFAAAFDRLPTTAELSDKTGIDTEMIQCIINGISPVKSIYEPVNRMTDYTATIADNIADTSTPFEDEIAAADIRQIVRDALMCLPPKERKVLQLYYFNGLSCRDIARIFDTVEKNIEYRLSKGRRLLRQLPTIQRLWLEMKHIPTL